MRILDNNRAMRKRYKGLIGKTFLRYSQNNSYESKRTVVKDNLVDSDTKIGLGDFLAQLYNDFYYALEIPEIHKGIFKKSIPFFDEILDESEEYMDICSNLFYPSTVFFKLAPKEYTSLAIETIKDFVDNEILEMINGADLELGLITYEELWEELNGI